VIHKDFLVRQIEFMSEAIACTVLNKESAIKYETQGESQIELYLLCTLLYDLIENKSVNEAENLLFEKIDPNKNDHLTVALEFYSKLNSMTDSELEYADFSREEIAKGLHEVKALFNLSI
jgi:hypothetical protein